MESRLKFYGIMNKYKKFFLPFADSVIGGVRYETLLIVGGCNGLNVAFNTAQRIIFTVDPHQHFAPPVSFQAIKVISNCTS